MKYNASLALSIMLLMFVTIACGQPNSSIIAKNAIPVLVSNEYSFTEGPAVDKHGNVYFTDQPNNQILKWNCNGKVEQFMSNSGRANGLYFDNEGNLLACADEKNQLWKIDEEKNITIMLENINGKRMNGPNDLWVDPKGGIYFTDPYYQRDYWKHTTKEITKENLYYLLPDNSNVIIADSNFIKPNGLIGNAEGTMLYVADIGDSKTYSFSINPDGTLTNRTLFAKMGSDGMTIDNKGNIYLTGKGVTVFNDKGGQIEHIPIDRAWTANVTFGGKNRNILFITAMNSVFTLEMNVKGIK